MVSVQQMFDRNERKKERNETKRNEDGKPFYYEIFENMIGIGRVRLKCTVTGYS